MVLQVVMNIDMDDVIGGSIQQWPWKLIVYHKSPAATCTYIAIT